MLAGGGLDDLAAGGPHRRQHPLELHGGEDVGVLAVAVVAEEGRVDQVVANGHDDGGHLPGQQLLAGHEEVDALGPASLNAAIAREVVGWLIQAEVKVYQVRPRNSLRHGCVDGLARGHAHVELVGYALRADVDAQVAARAFVGDEARPQLDAYAKAACLSLYGLHLCGGKDLDVGVLSDLGEFGHLNSYGAVQGGEVLIQGGHLAADGGRLLHQDHLGAGLGQVQGGLNAGDAAAYD